MKSGPCRPPFGDREIPFKCVNLCAQFMRGTGTTAKGVNLGNLAPALFSGPLELAAAKPASLSSLPLGAFLGLPTLF